MYISFTSTTCKLFVDLSWKRGEDPSRSLPQAKWNSLTALVSGLRPRSPCLQDLPREPDPGGGLRADPLPSEDNPGGLRGQLDRRGQETQAGVNILSRKVVLVSLSNIKQNLFATVANFKRHLAICWLPIAELALIDQNHTPADKRDQS